MKADVTGLTPPRDVSVAEADGTLTVRWTRRDRLCEAAVFAVVALSVATFSWFLWDSQARKEPEIEALFAGVFAIFAVGLLGGVAVGVMNALNAVSLTVQPARLAVRNSLWRSNDVTIDLPLAQLHVQTTRRWMDFRIYTLPIAHHLIATFADGRRERLPPMRADQAWFVERTIERVRGLVDVPVVGREAVRVVEMHELVDGTEPVPSAAMPLVGRPVAFRCGKCGAPVPVDAPKLDGASRCEACGTLARPR